MYKINSSHFVFLHAAFEERSAVRPVIRVQWPANIGLQDLDRFSKNEVCDLGVMDGVTGNKTEPHIYSQAVLYECGNR